LQQLVNKRTSTLLAVIVFAVAIYSCGRWYYYNVRSNEWGGAGGASTTMAERDEMELQAKWFDVVNTITPVLDAYYHLHPEKFCYVGADDEVTIEGLDDYIQKNNPYLSQRLAFHWGVVLDPWNEPLHFVMIRGDKSYAEARGAKGDVMLTSMSPMPSYTNEKEKLGLCKHSLKGIEDQRGSSKTLWVMVYKPPN
jgi:hypothetical protein